RLAKDDGFAVPREVAEQRPIEPGDVALGFVTRSSGDHSDLSVILPEQHTPPITANVVQSEHGRNAQYEALLTREIHGVQSSCGSKRRGCEPYLASIGGPGKTLDRTVMLRLRFHLTVTVDNDDITVITVR